MCCAAEQEKWAEETGPTLHWPLPLSIMPTLQGLSECLWGRPRPKGGCAPRPDEAENTAETGVHTLMHVQSSAGEESAPR